MVVVIVREERLLKINAIQCLHVYISTINLTKMIIGDVGSDDVPFDMRAISIGKMGIPAAARLQYLVFLLI